VDVVGSEPIAQCRLEGIDGCLVPPQIEVRLADEPVPAPTTAPLIGVTDLLGMAEPNRFVQEHPERTCMAICQIIEHRAVVDHAVECGLPRIIGQGAHTLGVIDDAGAGFVVQFVDGPQGDACDFRLRRLPIDLGRKLDAGVVEIGLQRRGRHVADETRH